MWQDRMKRRGIWAEVGAQLNSVPTPLLPQWPRTPRGLWSGSSFLGASLSLPWDPLVPSEAGAGPLALPLPPWTARTCQRCWAPGVGRGSGDRIHTMGTCIPRTRLASAARSWLPLPERGGAIRPAARPPPPVCSARRLASIGGAGCSRLRR